MKNQLKIVFMGTPNFAVPGLERINRSKHDLVAVVTAPDKPAGRGKIVRHSPVKNCALLNNLKILQPINLKDPLFVEQLEKLEPDLIVVVAFRMLPEVIWKLPKLGTINLHASLLPQYRGAAPINWAIINGEKETGVTTFFINETIDTGEIIFTEKVIIHDKETAGELHDRLMMAGANLLIKTIDSLHSDNYRTIPQTHDQFDTVELKVAPKIYKVDCKIKWNSNAHKINNLIRGLSPVPAAFAKLISVRGESYLLKVFRAQPIESKVEISNDMHTRPGIIMTDRKTFLYVCCSEGLIALEEVQLEGKKRMTISEFLRGFKVDESWKFD